MVVCLCISVYGLYIYRISKDIFNPISMFIWPITVGYIVFLSLYYSKEIQSMTLIIYLLGILSFLLGFLFHRFLQRYPFSYNTKIAEQIIWTGNTSFTVLKIIAALGVFATIAYVVRVAYAGPFGSNIIRNLRYMGNYENTRSFISKYGLVAAKVVLYIIFYQVFVNGVKKNKKWLPFLFIGVIFGLLATVARTELIDDVIALYYIYSLKNRVRHKNLSLTERLKEKWKALLLVIAIIFLFVYIAIATEKIGNRNFLNSDFFFYRYAGQELKNFDSYILGNSFQTKGYYSLGVLGRVLAVLHLGPNNELFMEIASKYRGPVCSFISAPYADFGIVGVVITMFVQGLFHSYIYMKSLRQGGYWAIFYTTCIFSNVMAFYAFQYMMSSQVYVLLMLVFLHFSLCGTTIVYTKTPPIQRMNAHK